MIFTVPIKENRQFMRLYKKGKFFVGKLMVLYVAHNGLDINRIGITVSKKIGKSVQRNRFRRLIRESYRLHEIFVKKGFDCVFVARENDPLPEFYDINREMRFLMKKLSIFDQEKWECSRKLQ